MRIKRLLLLIGCGVFVSALFLFHQSRLNAQGEGWVEVGPDSAASGGISNNPDESGSPSIGFRPDGTPCIAWENAINEDVEIYVRCWNGDVWEQIGTTSASGGGISNNSGESTTPSLAISSTGKIYIAWQDTSGGNAEIYVRRWANLAWEEVGTGSATGGGISNNSGESLSPTLALNSEGNPVVAWQDNSSGNFEIYIRQWDGENWVTLSTNSATAGGISNTSAESSNPSLAISTNDDVYVAWADKSDGDNEIYIRQFKEGSWQEIGQESATNGGVSDNSSTSRTPSVALYDSGNPIITWSDNASGNYEILARHWNGTTWSPAGTGAASDGGVSTTSGNSNMPKVSVAAGIPYVAWYDNSSGDFETYIRRLIGDTWQEVGAGSATGGGVSDNTGASGILALGISADGQPYLTWGDNTSGNYEVYVLYWPDEVDVPTPTPTATASPQPTTTSTAIATSTATTVATVTPTTTTTSTQTPQATTQPTLTATSTKTPQPTATATIQVTPSPESTSPSSLWALFPVVIRGATATPTATPTSPPTATFTATPIPTATATNTLVPPTATSLPPTFTPTIPAPTATATQAPNCSPSYPDFCIPPPPPDLDCGDIPRKNFTVLQPDPHRFDLDDDGIGCESSMTLFGVQLSEVVQYLSQLRR